MSKQRITRGTPRKRRTSVQPATNYSYWKRQSIKDGSAQEMDTLSRLAERLSPAALAKLRIVQYDPVADALGLYDEE